MPIIPESYPDRRPKITNEETRLMKQYVSAAGSLSGLHAKSFIDRLARFEQPYVDTSLPDTFSKEPVKHL